MSTNMMSTSWISRELQIGNPTASWWTVAAVGAGLLVLLAVAQRYRARRRFATPDRLDDCFGNATFFSRHPLITGFSSALLTAISLALLTLALMDIRWGKSEQEVPQSGIEILFLLDVSRSMLAQDVTPNRLARAKQMIRDMVQRMAGDRVGLILFAGESRQTIPLTNHYEDFSQMLEEAGPHSLRRGGSRLGDAIATAGRGFLEKTTAQRVIVVLTDGEDQESEPVKTAKRLHDEEQAIIFTVGLGDMESGARIPELDLDRPHHETGRYVKYRGQPVWSKMNGEILSQVANVSGGVYIPAGTKHVDMGAIYDRYIAGLPTMQFESAKVNAHVARFQWFAVPALLLLLLDFASKLSWRKSDPSAWKASTRKLAILFVTLFASPTVATAQSSYARQIAASYNHGVELYRQGDLAAAAEEFSRAAASPDNSLAAAARYNRATALYALTVQSIAASAEPDAEPPTPEVWKATLQQAIDAFRSALHIQPQWDNARANLEKAIRLLDRIEQQEQQQQESQNQDQSGEPDDSSDSSSDESESDESESDESESDESESEESKSDEAQSEQSQSEESESEQPEPESEPEESDSGSSESQQESQPSPSEEPGGESSDSAEGDGAEGDAEEGDAAENPASMPDTSEADPSTDTAAEGDDEQPPTPPEDVSGELSSDASEESSASPEEASDGEGSATTEIPSDRSMTAEEAMKMLQAIRDRDMIRRFRLQQLQQSRQIPVDKDW